MKFFLSSHELDVGQQPEINWNCLERVQWLGDEKIIAANVADNPLLPLVVGMAMGSALVLTLGGFPAIATVAAK